MPGEVVDFLKELLGNFYGPIRSIILLFVPFYDPYNRLFGLYCAVAGLIAFGLYATNKKHQSVTWKGLLRFLFPKEIYQHWSTKLDVKFYLINGVLKAFVNFGAVLVSADLLSQGVYDLLNQYLGELSPQFEVGLAAQVVYSLSVVLAIDFGFFFGHYIQHMIPCLWEFHAVHHSPEVLNPLSDFRFHPVDLMIEGTCMAVCGGMVTGLFRYLLADGVTLLTVFGGVSFFYFLFSLTAILRHTHIWLSFGWRLNHVLSSPAQHQIHHSVEERHIDKNFGQIFSIWDYWFGTLYVPRRKEQFCLGLTDNKHQQYNTVPKLYLLPFVKSLKQMGRMLNQH